MAIHPAEAATLRAFVEKKKRERLIALFGNARGRDRARSVLNHFVDWDVRFVHPARSSNEALDVLRSAGAPAQVHIMSDSPLLDGRDLPLEDAIDECERHSFASIVCCLPGALAFYFDEVATPRTRLLLRRTASDR